MCLDLTTEIYFPYARSSEYLDIDSWSISSPSAADLMATDAPPPEF
jgi:hypothetical protein